MALHEDVTSVLNEQINKELYSAYLYLTFADYYDDRGLKGFANWYQIQAKEEMDHAMAIRRYLLDNDYKPTMEAIAKPDKLFGSDPKGLYDLDREYQTRVYTQMTALPL